MTPKEKNDWLFFLIVFGPLILIPLAFGLAGFSNIGTVAIGGITSILAGKMALALGVVKNRVD